MGAAILVLECMGQLVELLSINLRAYMPLLKGYKDGGEVPVDSIVLALYQLQVYFHYEIQRGLAGIISFI